MASGWAKGETEDGPRKEMDTWVGMRMTERWRRGIILVRVFGLKGYNKRNTVYCNTNVNSCERAVANMSHFSM